MASLKCGKTGAVSAAWFLPRHVQNSNIHDEHASVCATLGRGVSQKDTDFVSSPEPKERDRQEKDGRTEFDASRMDFDSVALGRLSCLPIGRVARCASM